MNAQSIVPWLKANYMILLPSFLNILASKIPTKADYDWAKKLKRPWFNLPLLGWIFFINSTQLAVGYGLNLLWTDAKLWTKPAHFPALVFLAISLLCTFSWNLVGMRLRNFSAGNILTVISVVTGTLAAFYASNLNVTAGNCISYYTAFYGYALAVGYCMARDNKPRKLNIKKK